MRNARGRRGDQKGGRRERAEPVEWTPKTKLGQRVKAGEITSLDQLVKLGKTMREAAIVDALVPGLEESVVPIGKGQRPFKMVQRMTDSGRRNKYEVLVVVGNHAGYVGLGQSTAKEFGPAKDKALTIAKLNLFKVPLGCGSWECGCGGQHTVPYISEGQCGSVRVKLIPAPKGLGLAANATAKVVLSLAGIKDVWSKSDGHTASRTNLAWATFDALRSLDKVKVAK